jgi:hypothetical protein
MIKPGEEILIGNGRRFRVLDLVPLDEEDESPFVGLLKVEGHLTSVFRKLQLDSREQLPAALAEAIVEVRA